MYFKTRDHDGKSEMLDTRPPQNFIFSSKQNVHLLAITSDRTGSSLPSHYGPWKPTDDHILREVYRQAGENTVNAIRAAIVARGFYLSRSDGIAW